MLSSSGEVKCQDFDQHSHVLVSMLKDRDFEFSEKEVISFLVVINWVLTPEEVRRLIALNSDVFQYVDSWMQLIRILIDRNQLFESFSSLIDKKSFIAWIVAHLISVSSTGNVLLKSVCKTVFEVLSVCSLSAKLILIHLLDDLDSLVTLNEIINKQNKTASFYFLSDLQVSRSFQVDGETNLKFVMTPHFVKIINVESCEFLQLQVTMVLRRHFHVWICSIDQHQFGIIYGILLRQLVEGELNLKKESLKLLNPLLNYQTGSISKDQATSLIDSFVAVLRLFTDHFNHDIASVSKIERLMAVCVDSMFESENRRRMLKLIDHDILLEFIDRLPLLLSASNDSEAIGSLLHLLLDLVHKALINVDITTFYPTKILTVITNFFHPFLNCIRHHFDRDSEHTQRVLNIMVIVMKIELLCSDTGKTEGNKQMEQCCPLSEFLTNSLTIVTFELTNDEEQLLEQLKICSISAQILLALSNDKDLLKSNLVTDYIVVVVSLVDKFVPLKMNNNLVLQRLNRTNEEEWHFMLKLLSFSIRIARSHVGLDSDQMMSCTLMIAPWIHVLPQLNELPQVASYQTFLRDVPTSLQHNPAIVKDCLTVLSILPPTFLFKIRYQIFTLITTDMDPEMFKLSSNLLPYFLSSTNSITKLFSECALLLFRPTQEKSLQCDMVMQCCFNNFGILVCMLAQLNIANHYDNSTSNFLFRCKICDEHNGCLASSTSIALDFDIYEKIFQTIQVLSPTCFNDLAKCLCRIFSHALQNEHLIMLLNTSLFLIEDDQEDVRNSYCKCLKVICQRGIEHGMLLDKMESGLLSSEVSSSVRITYLACVCELAKYSNDVIFERCIMIFSNICVSRDNDQEVVFAARSHISRIATWFNVSTKNLFQQHCEQLLKSIFIETICRDDSPDDKLKSNIVSFAIALSLAFGYCIDSGEPDIGGMLTDCLRYLVPQVIVHKLDIAHLVLVNVAEVLGTNRYSLLVHNFQYIFTSVYVNLNDTERMKDVFDFVERHGVTRDSKSGREKRWTLSQFISWCHLDCVYKAIFALSCSRNIPNALNFLISKTKTFKKSATANSVTENILEYIQPQLFGTLIRFDECFRTCCAPRERLTVLRSLIELMRMVETKHLTTVRLKAVATLRLAVDTSLNHRRRHSGSKVVDVEQKGYLHQFLESCCEAWITLLSNITVEGLGTIVCQVLVNLLPLIENCCCDNLTSVFQLMFIEKYLDLKAFVDPFLLAYRSLPVVKKLNFVFPGTNNANESLCCVIQKMIGAISENENAEVKVIPLKKLKMVLLENLVELLELIDGSERCNPVINQLVISLMKCASVDSTDVRYQTSECFGILGAIDPGRLNLEPSDRVLNSHGYTMDPSVYLDFSNDRGTESKFISSLAQNPKFPIVLLTELGRLFLAASGSHMYDICAFTIQEVLKLKCLGLTSVKARADPTTGPGMIWRRLSDWHDLFIPLFNTEYKSMKPSVVLNQESVLYGSSESLKWYSCWLSSWYAVLLSMVTFTEARALFQACKFVAERNTHFAQFLICRLVLQILVENVANVQVLAEILTVLKSATNLASNGDSSIQKTTDDKSSEFTEYRKCARTIFVLIDFLTDWLRYKQNDSNYDPGTRTDRSVGLVQSFYLQIPNKLLAHAAFLCQDYTRSLSAYEQYINGIEDLNISQHISFLQELYSRLDEPDCVEGALTVKLALRGECATFKEQIVNFESVGNYTDALPFHEQAIDSEPDSLSNHQAYIKCLMHLNQPIVLRSYLRGLAYQDTKPIDDAMLNSFRIETAAKLREWDDVDTIIGSGKPFDNNDGASTAAILCSVRKSDYDQFRGLCDEAKFSISRDLASDTTDYTRAYKHVVRLQSLFEVERGSRLLLQFEHKESDLDNGSFDTLNMDKIKFCSVLDHRLNIMQPNRRYVEPVLEVRRQLFELANNVKPEQLFKDQIGRSWLQSAKIARKANHLPAAWGLIVKANEYRLIETFVEEAKFYWKKGSVEQALKTLDKGLLETFSKSNDNLDGLSPREKNVYGKAQLLCANYSAESRKLESFPLVNKYQKLAEVLPNYEQIHYRLACFMDKFHEQASRGTSAHKSIRTMRNFINAMKYGSKYTHHAMPRLLTLWFDTAEKEHDAQKLKRQQNPYIERETPPIAKRPRKSTPVLTDPLLSQGPKSDENQLQLLNEEMHQAISNLPPYQFYVAYSQIISRIMHPEPGVFKILKEIIVQLIIKYPQQCMWQSLAIVRSKDAQRKARMDRIMSEVKARSVNIKPLIESMLQLVDALVQLADLQCGHGTHSIKRYERTLTLCRLKEHHSLSTILLPMQNLMQIVFPTKVNTESLSQHNPFPNTPVYIHSILDTFETLSSLQKPKKITIRGTDGRLYNMLCKPKEDLRQDKRYLQFCQLVNTCLRNDPEARKRQLYIRTYTVVPLSESCGLIEWVPNMKPMRAIITELLPDFGGMMTTREVKAEMAKKDAPHSEKLRIFKNVFLARHTPVLHTWFQYNFSDPNAWYVARNNFCRTTAVMSMVGFIVGLGDRHGENILIDTKTGDAFHVDFNILFNKGAELDVPEKVPFRLTRSMVKAMGPLGVEGVFRRSCEHSMRVMRERIDMLCIALETFIHDPLIDWIQKQSSSKSNSSSSQLVTHINKSGDQLNKMAHKKLSDIRTRLKGSIKMEFRSSFGLPLSVEGQVNYLIDQAISESLLCEMYIGWAAYL